MGLTELCQKAEQAIAHHRILDSGVDGVIYDLDDKVVLKLVNGYFDRHHREGNSQTAAEYEYGIGRDLFDHQVQVPEFYGLYQYHGPLCRLPYTYSFIGFEPYWGIFMQRINGGYVYLPGKVKSEAERQFTKQLKLAQALGYKPRDVSLNVNTLFDHKQNKLYLIDFTRWEKK